MAADFHGRQNLQQVYFAGEHTSSTHGWIQGAIESGIRVAYEVNNLPKSEESTGEATPQASNKRYSCCRMRSFPFSDTAEDRVMVLICSAFR